MDSLNRILKLSLMAALAISLVYTTIAFADDDEHRGGRDGDHDRSANINTQPVAINNEYGAIDGAKLSVAAPGVLANDTDADGDTLTAVLDTGVSNGTLAFSADGDGSFDYTPNPGFTGTDSFTYFAHDGTDPSVTAATVTINVDTFVDGDIIANVGVYATPVGNPISDTASRVSGVLYNDFVGSRCQHSWSARQREVP